MVLLAVELMVLILVMTVVFPAVRRHSGRPVLLPMGKKAEIVTKDETDWNYGSDCKEGCACLGGRRVLVRHGALLLHFTHKAQLELSDCGGGGGCDGDDGGGGRGL
jgi:hypothetical protein